MAKIAGFTTSHKVDQFLSKDMLDKQARRQLTQFMEQVELTVFQANKEVLRREIPNLDRDSFIRFAVQVAEARALRQAWPGDHQGRPQGKRRRSGPAQGPQACL